MMYLSEVRWTKTVVSTFVEAGASHEPLDYSSGAFRCNVRGRDTEANPNPNPNPNPKLASHHGAIAIYSARYSTRYSW